MTRIIPFVVFFLSLANQQANADERICLERESLPAGTDVLRMQEHEFSMEHGLKAVDFLQGDFSKRIWGENAVEDFNAWSGHCISQINSLKFIEGALLKQQVIIVQLRLKEASGSESNIEEVSKITENLERLTNQFCKLLESAAYVD